MTEIKIKERQKELGIRILAGVIVLVIGFWFIVSPFFKETALLRKQIGFSAERVKLYEEVDLVREKLAKLEGFFLSGSERSVILGKVSGVASKEKLEVESLTPKTEPGENYLKLIADVVVRGHFFSIVKFLKNVDSFNPAIKISSVIVKRPPSDFQNGKASALKANIVLETYLKQKARKNRVQ